LGARDRNVGWQQARVKAAATVLRLPRLRRGDTEV